MVAAIVGIRMVRYLHFMTGIRIYSKDIFWIDFAAFHLCSLDI